MLNYNVTVSNKILAPETNVDGARIDIRFNQHEHNVSQITFLFDVSEININDFSLWVETEINNEKRKELLTVNDDKAVWTITRNTTYQAGNGTIDIMAIHNSDEDVPTWFTQRINYTVIPSIHAVDDPDAVEREADSVLQKIGKVADEAVEKMTDTVFVPSVDDNGILSWTNGAGLDNPEPVKIVGEDGYTPVKGTDYWTNEDIAEIQKYVNTQILGGMS